MAFYDEKEKLYLERDVSGLGPWSMSFVSEGRNVVPKK